MRKDLSRERQTCRKAATQSHGSSPPPRRSIASKDPKTAGLSIAVLSPEQVTEGNDDDRQEDPSVVTEAPTGQIDA